MLIIITMPPFSCCLHLFCRRQPAFYALFAASSEAAAGTPCSHALLPLAFAITPFRRYAEMVTLKMLLRHDIIRFYAVDRGAIIAALPRGAIAMPLLPCIVDTYYYDTPLYCRHADHF